MHDGEMERWRVEDLMELADAAGKAGLQSFIVKRMLQRLERGEITILRAIRLISPTSYAASLSTIKDDASA
jgi:hypothetical protein